VLMHNAFDEFGIPPDLGIVLQPGMVHGDASLGVDAQGLTRPLELMYPRVADSIIITCVASSALMAKTCFQSAAGIALPAWWGSIQHSTLTSRHDEQPSSDGSVAVQDPEDAG
jgi:hypothetical protein